MSKIINIKDEVAKQIDYYRKKMGGDYQLASYSMVMERALKESKMWRKPKPKSKKKA